ncbi:MAG: HAD-IB family phosphatase [bacterium]
MIIFFDVDSTLVTFEGLDWLAERNGVGQEVKALTTKSMNGEALLEEIFAYKINLIAPTKADFKLLAVEYQKNLVSGLTAVISELKQQGHQLGIVTGNFLDAVLPLADRLAISRDFVFANQAQHDKAGNYLGFAAEQPLASSTGKSEIITAVRNKYPEEKLVMIGDSMSDAETKNVVDYFVGFGGVIVREKVQLLADYYLTNMAELLDVPFLKK